MLTNGFAVFKGEAAPSLVRRATDRVGRYAEDILVDAGDGFEEFERAHLSGKRSIALAFSVEKRGGALPLVHGFVDGAIGDCRRSLPEGEFSLVGKGRDGHFGARDPLGTRGLWFVPAGSRGVGSLASDHRLLDGRKRLLPAGAVYDSGRSKKVRGEGEICEVPDSFREAAERLASLIEASVKRRVEGHRRVAVSFSGGLDSSIIALTASRYSEVVLCSAYTVGSRDERQATRAADLLGLGLEDAVMDEQSVLDKSKEANLPSDEVTVMDRALWCIYSTASEHACRRKARIILLGQLADELFGGYKKYAIAARESGVEAAEKMMSRDVGACADKGFLRDEAACSAWAEARFPFADSRIAALAARLPLDYKIRGEERKAILRAAALELGLPEELAKAPKKAAQFSSGIAKLLERHYRPSDSFYRS